MTKQHRRLLEEVLDALKLWQAMADNFSGTAIMDADVLQGMAISEDKLRRVLETG